MKQIVLAASIITGSLLACSCGNAQLIQVNDRPISSVVVRPVAPRPTAIWLEPEWVWRGSRYVYINGYWANPRVGYRYSPGYWRKTKTW